MFKTVVAGLLGLIFFLVVAAVVAQPNPRLERAVETPTPARVPCSFRTPGLQYECVDKAGNVRPAGPAAARQSKHFEACMARGRSGDACLGEAARVK
jgi:hypothetical protein